MEFEVDEAGYLHCLGSDWPSDPREALLASIQKWRTIAEWHDEHPNTWAEIYPAYGNDANSCALCRLYNLPFETSSFQCVECPVYQATGKKHCGDTPYFEYHEYPGPSSDTAWREVEFLESLLDDSPEDHP